MTYATISNGISPRTAQTNKHNIQARTNVHILYRCCSFSSDPKAGGGEKKKERKKETNDRRICEIHVSLPYTYI